jgi:hypothetical protein
VESPHTALHEFKNKSNGVELMVSMFKESLITPEVLLHTIETQILNCPAVNNILSVTDQIDSQGGSTTFEDRFDEAFVIGPGGINMLLRPLDNIFQILVGLDDTKLSTPTMKKLQDFSEAMLLCLLHLRTKYHRSLWDPVGGIRAFATIYNAKGDVLPVCSV